MWQGQSLQQKIFQYCAKKQVVLGNVFMPVIDRREEQKEDFITLDLETVKCIKQNVKLNEDNKEVFFLLDSDNEANLIS